MTQDNIQTPSEGAPTVSGPHNAGAILAAHRRQAGLSVEDVAAKLKLAKRQVEALEAERYEALPGNTFVRGFVRNYARLLQIDPQPLLNYLADHLPAEAPQAALPRLQDEAMPMLRPGSSGNPFVRALLFGVLGLVLLLGGVAWLLENFKREPMLTLPGQNPPNATTPAAVSTDATPVGVQAQPASPNGPVPEVAQSAVEPAAAAQPGGVASTLVPTAAPATQPATTVQPSVATPAPTPAPVPAPTSVPQSPVAQAVPAMASDLMLTAHADSWVQITDATGKRLVNEIVKAGDSRTVGGKPPYQVRIGNGRHTDLSYKGKAVDLAPYIKVDVANLELK